ncbi:MAG: LytR/AlgR family response regulator transcription factor [Saprospiraceae bacterium]
MKINCIIVEDEPIALERTKYFIEKLPLLNLVAAFDNAIDALAYLKLNPVDLIFLDIEMEELTGIELLENATITAQVIITTAYDKYALKGYELNVVDYLLKPFSFERFLKAVDKVQVISKTKTPQEFIFIKTAHRLEKIMVNEILHIEGMGEYRRIFTTGKQIMTLQTFTELEELFSPQIICRVHKSHMVALNKIDSVERSRIKIGEKLIPISETYRSYFLNLINPNLS